MACHIQRFTLQHVNPHERACGQSALQDLQALTAIDPAVITALVASGPLNVSDEFVAATIESFAGRQADPDQLATVRKACNAHDVADELTSVEIQLAESGYVLGLAVGLALGSGDPFGTKGGTR